MILCLHGWESAAKTQPMTLLIFKISLDCHSPDFRFQSVRMWLEFDEDSEITPPNTEKASPSVVSYAPYVRTETWNEATENITEKKNYGGELGVEYVATAGAHANKEREQSYTRKHFDRGSAHHLVDEEQRRYGVNWYVEQNQLTDYGVKPNFHLAVLLKRSHTESDNRPISFSCIFDMETEAGFMYNIEQSVRRLFRLGKPEDEALYFDGKTDLVSEFNGEADRIRKLVDKEKLGELVQDGRLSNLLRIDTEVGGEPLEGLEPFEPKKA